MRLISAPCGWLRRRPVSTTRRHRDEARRGLHLAGGARRAGAARLAAGGRVFGHRQRRPQRALRHGRDRAHRPDAFGAAVPAPRTGAERDRTDRPHRSWRADLFRGQRAEDALCRAAARLSGHARTATTGTATGRRWSRWPAPGAAAGGVAAGWPAAATARRSAGAVRPHQGRQLQLSGRRRAGHARAVVAGLGRWPDAAHAGAHRIAVAGTRQLAAARRAVAGQPGPGWRTVADGFARARAAMRGYTLPSRVGQRGVALLLVLWACTLLAILLGGYAAMARTEGLQARFKYDQATVVVHATDEGGKVDLNTDTPDVLRALFRAAGLPADQASQLADRVV